MRVARSLAQFVSDENICKVYFVFAWFISLSQQRRIQFSSVLPPKPTDENKHISLIVKLEMFTANLPLDIQMIKLQLQFLCVFSSTERDSGHEPVPPPQHRVLLHLLCGQG